jgi:hypothetical protein
MQPNPPTSVVPSASEPVLASRSTEIVAASLALLAALEASLTASQRALLLRDATALAERTREQIALRLELELLWGKKSASRNPAHNDLALASALRPALLRVLHLGRVQAALLERAQRWLGMVANLLAGPAANYLPPAGLTQTGSTPERLGPCRA